MEFGSIRSLPMDIVSGYLALRKAAPTWNMFLIYKCVNKLEFKQRFLNLIFEVYKYKMFFFKTMIIICVADWLLALKVSEGKKYNS